MDDFSDRQREFELEHAKRDKRITDLQRRNWAESLLASLADSAAYRKACTPQARLAEQTLLNRLLEEWKSKQSSIDRSATDEF
jgi:transcription elongation GreA/GreB family factor